MTHVHQTAPTRFVEANGIRFAYRRFGKAKRCAARLQSALHGHHGLLGPGGDGWLGSRPRGDLVQQRRRLQQLRGGADHVRADGRERGRLQPRTSFEQDGCARLLDRRHGRAGDHAAGARSRPQTDPHWHRSARRPRNGIADAEQHSGSSAPPMTRPSMSGSRSNSVRPRRARRRDGSF